MKPTEIADIINKDPRELGEDDLLTLGHEQKPMLRVIRAKCLDCCGGSELEVRLCPSYRCDLWPYRMNKNPFRKRELTEEQRQEVAERLRGAKA